jgi:hypothetical protein
VFAAVCQSLSVSFRRGFTLALPLLLVSSRARGSTVFSAATCGLSGTGFPAHHARISCNTCPIVGGRAANGGRYLRRATARRKSRHATLPFSEFRTPAERPRPLARHAATDRSSIEPDREGLGPNTRWVRRLPYHQERPTKALQRALTASGREGPGWHVLTACIAPGGPPMSPISRPERLPARLHELIPGSAGLSLSPFHRDLTSSGDCLGGVASMLERISRHAWLHPNCWTPWARTPADRSDRSARNDAVAGSDAMR